MTRRLEKRLNAVLAQKGDSRVDVLLRGGGDGDVVHAGAVIVVRSVFRTGREPEAVAVRSSYAQHLLAVIHVLPPQEAHEVSVESEIRLLDVELNVAEVCLHGNQPPY